MRAKRPGFPKLLSDVTSMWCLAHVARSSFASSLADVVNGLSAEHLLGGVGVAMLMELPCGRRVGRAVLPNAADDGEGGALTIVTVVGVGVDGVAREVDFHDPSLQVVEVRLTGVKDRPSLFDRHDAVAFLEEAETLGTCTVVERCQDDSLVETADIYVRGHQNAFSSPLAGLP
jgi:hypothetical protein